MRDIGRREAMRYLGGAVLAGAAACTPKPGNRAVPTPSPLPSIAGKLSIATWPIYIDVDEETKARPTILEFQDKTGIDVTYREVIEDSETFYGTIRPALAAGEPTGWDVIVVSDWLVSRMARLGYLEPLRHDALPNFKAFGGSAFTDPSYDRGNRHSVAWQGGVTGIAYDPKQTTRAINSVEDLFDPAFAGRSGLLSEMLDTMSMVMMLQGVSPEKATVADARRARDRLRAERGKIRNFYGNEYIDALARGELALTMAWSGDVLQLQSDHPDLVFVVPREGGILWTDDMCIPRGAAHPADAHAWMDNAYDPPVAARIASFVQYVTPVPAARSLMLDQASKIEDKEERAEAERLANTSLIFPTDETLKRLRRYPVLSAEDDRVWNDLFNEVVSA